MFKRIAAILLTLCCLFSVTAAQAAKVASEFHSGLAWFEDSKTGKYGYIDTAGNIVIDPKYDQAFDFNDYGFAKVHVSKKHNKLGSFLSYQFIDKDGKVVAKTPGDTNSLVYQLETWYGGYGVTVGEKVGKHPKWGWIGLIGPKGFYLQKSGNTLASQTVFTYFGPFTEDGFAVVGKGTKNSSADYKTSSSVDTQGLRTLMLGEFKGNSFNLASTSYFFINKNGKQLGSNTYAIAPGNFSDGMAAVPGKANAKGAYTWGYIDAKGNQVIKPQYDTADKFQNGLAKVSKGGKYGYIDKSGNVVVEIKWPELGSFGDGLAYFKQGNKYGYLNTAGEIVIEAQYDSATAFSDGYAPVKDGVAWGVIDTKGNTVVPFAYTSLRSIRGAGMFVGTEFNSPVIVNEQGDLITVVLKDGQLPSTNIAEGTPVKLLEMPALTNGLTPKMFTDENGTILSMNLYSNINGENFHITTGSGKQVIISAGLPAFEGAWDAVAVSQTSNGWIFRVSKNNKYGYVNDKGQLIVAPEYDKAGLYADDAAIVWKGNTWYILDTSGAVVF